MTPPIIQRLKEYAETENGLERIANRVDLHPDTIRHLIEDPKAKIRYSTINCLYSYFHMPRDDYYREKLKEWRRIESNPVGEFFRNLRLSQNKTISEVSKEIALLTERTLARIENGEVIPNEQTETLDLLCSYFAMSEQEKKHVKEYVQCLRAFSRTIAEKALS